MKRKVWYIVQCTIKENQDGIFHFGKPYSKKDEAVKMAKLMREDFGNDHFVIIEKHAEMLEYGRWEIDHESGGVSDREDY